MSSADHTQSSSRGIYHEIVRLQQSGRCGALATPVRLSGSVPFGRHSRLLVREDGSTQGTVGGGLLEAQVLRQAPEVIATDKARVLEFDLSQDEAASSGMICGGRCIVLIEPIRHDRAADVYSSAARCENDRARAALITILSDEQRFRKLAFLPGGVLVGSSEDADTDKALCELAERCCAGEDPCFVEDPIRVHVQPIFSPPSLYIFGAGHVAIPVAHLAYLVDFRTTVIDDRAEFANSERFRQADHVLVATVEEAFKTLTIGEDAYVVAITRGHALDEEVVAHALRTPAKYIGMIGSKRKVAAVCERLRSRGFSDADVARLHAPIGIEIGAETVEEIALSIVAEMVAVRRGSS